jgi:hypothetical protein
MDDQPAGIAGGIEAVAGPLQDFQSSALTIACICSSDAIYATEAEATARTLSELGASHVMMAGKPGNIEKLLSAAGVNEFVHAGQNVVSIAGATATQDRREQGGGRIMSRLPDFSSIGFDPPSAAAGSASGRSKLDHAGGH